MNMATVCFMVYSLVSICLIILPTASPASLKFIDLSYPFVENETLYWPGMTKFTHKITFQGIEPGSDSVFTSFGEFAAAEHGGTHMDAPIHYVRGGKTLGEVPLESMVGNAIVVNVSAKADKNPTYQMTVEDLKDWEKEHGRIPDDSIVLMYTGRGKYWPDEKKYFGVDDATGALNFPGMHPDAAQWLVDNNKIKLFGMDTPSSDFSKTKNYETHQILLGNNIPGVENMANLHLLPPKGMEVIAAPMKLKSGTGGPCRIFARISDQHPAADRVVGFVYVLLLIVVFLLVIYVLFYFVSRRKSKKIKV